MRVLVDLKSHFTTGIPEMTQVEKTPAPEEGTPINGRFVLPIVTGVEFPITSDDYILPVDGNDISSISFSHLLAQFPEFTNIYFNPLLTEAQLTELDPFFLFSDPFVPDPDYYPRFQTGYPTEGQMPTHTALLAQNNGAFSPRPGLIVTQDIDISALEPTGVREFMVYWKLLDFDVSHDVRAAYGDAAGQNTPAIRRVYEVDQEPDDFSAYITTDSGAPYTWTPVNLLETVTMVSPTTTFRVAFKSTADAKIFLANFAVLF
jgi:hypothetical protein